ncbi:pilus assembly protein [Paracidovorax sp. MALMAid1276]|uniref:pilus assembly protein n=1 Tax=Paracidovorax sp. MALMAid1276 TaxID=3411631 RepID=UPI003B9B9F4D
MPRTSAPSFRKHMLALAASAAVAPHGAWALDLSQAPPGTVEPYVTPNVIISVDDSGSMNFRLDQENATGATNNVVPNADGTWPPTTRRINVLKHALIGNGGTGGVFRDTSLLPDKKIRISWQAMWNNGNSPDATNVDSATMKTNSMRPWQGTHKTNFISFVQGLSANNGTPSHTMFKQADQYMRRTLGTNSPLATNPGVAGSPYLACRRTYHIMMTDGRWNGTAHAVPDTTKRDNATNITLPDGMTYGGATAAERAKSALYRDTQNNTLADWAFYSWAVPLHTTGMTGTMQPTADYRKAPATENFGKDTANNDAILDRYWNPRYNPATWPHMVTYTIGFSNMAVTWPGAPTVISPSSTVPFGYDGSFPSLATGVLDWPAMDNENKRSLDLWHAALNGRGRFYAVTQGEDLEKAFREIFGQINTQTDPDLSASATSGSNVSRSEVGKYTASYEPTKAWKGSVIADRVKSDGTTVSDPAWGGKTTADKLDAIGTINNRLILSWSDKWETSQPKGGVTFKWATDESNLSSAQKVSLQKNASGTDEGATKGQQRLNYIRGDRSLEGSETTGYTTAKPYRERQSRQGDIINSDVWYVGAPSSTSLFKGYSAFVRSNKARPGMLYVGGNDGMLHGFAAADGEEKIAYVPRGVIPNLTLLTDPQYNNKHRYFVDGSPMTGDIDINGGMQDPADPNYATYVPNWRTYLVGTLGLGGKGYYVMDVTNPTSTTSPSGVPGFSEASAAALVRADRTRGTTEAAPVCGTMTGAEQVACLKTVDEDKDIGHITAKPVRDDNDPMRSSQITLMNNNRWAVVMGNGYNSANQRPVLLIQYLDGARELLRIPATTNTAGTGLAADNGLAAPRVVDLNGDNRADVVYAGDNLGNLWKFDLTDANANNWKVAFGGSPLFTTRGPAALGGASRTKVQPISTVPTVRANDRNMQIGTGASAKTVKVGGMMVAFGTGRNVDKDDPASVDVQTLYSVLDNTRYREITTSLGKRLEVHPGAGTCPSGSDCVPAPAALGTGVTTAKLAQQKITETDAGAYGTVDIVNELKLDTWANFNGWYMDLPAVGERLLKPMEFYDASNLLTVWSQVPAKGSDVDPNVESCESTSVDGERQYRTFVNIMDGKRPSVQIVNKAGVTQLYSATANAGVSRAQVAKGPHSIIKKDKFENVDIDAKNNKENLASMPEESLRPSWRQIQ